MTALTRVLPPTPHGPSRMPPGWLTRPQRLTYRDLPPRPPSERARALASAVDRFAARAADGPLLAKLLPRCCHAKAAKLVATLSF